MIFFNELIWSKHFCQIGPSQKRRTLTYLHQFKDGVVLLDEEVRGVAPVVEHHVGLPVLGRDALVDAPPKVLLALAAPRKHRHARLGQRGGNLVLRRVDVARGPADLLVDRTTVRI